MKNVSYLARSGAVVRARGPRTTQRALAVAMALILAGFVALAACLAASARPSHAGTAAPAALTSPLVPTPSAMFLGAATARPTPTATPTATPAARLYAPALARGNAAPMSSNCPGVNLCNN